MSRFCLSARASREGQFAQLFRRHPLQGGIDRTPRRIPHGLLTVADRTVVDYVSLRTRRERCFLFWFTSSLARSLTASFVIIDIIRFGGSTGAGAGVGDGALIGIGEGVRSGEGDDDDEDEEERENFLYFLCFFFCFLSCLSCLCFDFLDDLCLCAFFSFFDDLTIDTHTSKCVTQLLRGKRALGRRSVRVGY